jgi:hypothetical protein
MIPRVNLCVFLAIALCVSVAFAQPSDATHAELQKQLSALESAKTDAEITAAQKEIAKVGETLTTEILALQEDTGELILRDDYFIDKANKPYVEKLTIRDTGEFPVAAAVIADGMITVAKNNHQDQIDYLTDWSTEEGLILVRLSKFQTVNGVKVWSEFLKEWKSEVTRLDRDRFRDALVQAALSILRVAKGIEEQHVKNARARVAKGGGVTTSATTSTGIPGADRYPHMYRRHTRIMLRIQRHYSR